MTDKYIINTSQNVPLELEIAGAGKRGIALVIDGLVLMAIFLFVFFLIAISGRQYSISQQLTILSIYGAIIFFYHFFMEVFTNGQSIGKKVMEIRVMQSDGSVPGLFHYLVRNLIRPIDTLHNLGLFPIFFSHNYQRFGDLAAGTIVVDQERNPATMRSNMLLKNRAKPKMPRYDRLKVMRLDTRDVELIHQVAFRYKEHINWRLIGLLAGKLKKKTAIQEEDTANIDFLLQLENDHRYFHEQDTQIPGQEPSLT